MDNLKQLVETQKNLRTIEKEVNKYRIQLIKRYQNKSNLEALYSYLSVWNNYKTFSTKLKAETEKFEKLLEDSIITCNSKMNESMNENNSEYNEIMANIQTFEQDSETSQDVDFSAYDGSTFLEQQSISISTTTEHQQVQTIQVQPQTQSIQTQQPPPSTTEVKQTVTISMDKDDEKESPVIVTKPKPKFQEINNENDDQNKNKNKNESNDNQNKDKDKDNDDESKEMDSSIIRIHNLSLDDMDCNGILNGIVPDELYVKARKEYKLPAYPLDKDNKLYPIKILSSMCMNKEIKINQKTKDKNHINPTVILSVGFSDLRQNLKYGKPELIIEALRNDEFAEKYEKIVHQIVDNLGLNLIIVIAYEPHESFTEKQLHFSRDDLLSCMEFVGNKIMQIGEKFKCPIIDLSRTLNPFDRDHYGSTAVEPSIISGQFIVDIIIKILSDWDWNDDKRGSKIYFGVKDKDKIQQQKSNKDSKHKPKSKDKDKDSQLIDDGDIQIIDNDKSYRSKYFNVLQVRGEQLNTAAHNTEEMALLDDLFKEDAQ
mmetsp:Transcript_26906/g.23699  ORF Transcript_26906/g.23699 Transcript_26906/m.23699 type:complete len:542 (-) Transcript_26906:64-1689(-)